MTIKIQQPSLGRVVIYTDSSGKEASGMITEVWMDHPGEIEFRNLNTNALHRTSHDADGAPGTWRYPPRVVGEIEVER